MVREISAGGVVVRRMRGRWYCAAIEPGGRPGVRALPKGIVEPGESTETTAAREVLEETGLRADHVARLGDVRYVYTRRGGERVFKVVTFHLLRWRGGRLDDIAPGMRIEVARAEWIPLHTAPKALSYRGERDMAVRALDVLERPI
jgi:8-oxo-dGTP pyrophosphatase MutT (NUDIX family)